ncbi:unnamed protein product [Pieris macdunnoughi]|uniref:Uncharacterized protein n=1 Tax=Pieris macdunnoughi TaxID=345717 RepID=A0A821XLQ7_9NEOP|nr:unnamed protein product [Pieris macdunnoughi]
MEFSSDDSVQDPNFMPDEDFSDTSTSDDNDSQIWNPPRFSRRLSTFSDGWMDGRTVDGRKTVQHAMGNAKS